MRILFLLMSFFGGAVWAEDFRDAYDISKKEFQELFTDTKREIAHRTGWEDIGTWFVYLDGPSLSDDDSKTDFYKAVLATWAAASAKTILPLPSLFSTDEEKEAESKHPTMRVRIRRILEDVSLVDVSHGYPLAGGAFSLIYRKDSGGWRLANVLSGGIR